MSAALQVYSRDFDTDFFRLPPAQQERIQRGIDELGRTLAKHSHRRLKGMNAFRIRVGDYRVIYDFDLSKGVLRLLAVGHRREVYRQ